MPRKGLSKLWFRGLSPPDAYVCSSPECQKDSTINVLCKRNRKTRLTRSNQTKMIDADVSKLNETSTNETISEVDKTKKATEKSNTKKVVRIKDYCYFCETEVLNFARHLTRNHAHEHEVIKFTLLPAGSNERRQLINILRNKGNYIKNSKICSKPVRKSYLPRRKCLPCENCLGFFSSKLLYRHRKKCCGSNTKYAQASGQNALLKHVKVDKLLKDEVFPRMMADKVSLEAKSDILICAFGARYLKTHREKHFISVTSRKMRELAKIILEIKKMDNTISNLFEALKPEYFDYFVDSAKIIARYDESKEVYGAPTFAMNIVTSLKQCCDIAIYWTHKKHTIIDTIKAATLAASFKTILHLFNTNWKFEVSIQAANNLNTQKWNKVTIVPLAADLRQLKEFLMDSSNTVMKKLVDVPNEQDYNTLMETAFCRVILLNRRRPGELQRMTLHDYLTYGNDKQSYDEFNCAISSTEKILLNKLKRVVIRGKRGRGVPVLFTPDVQEHLDVLVKLRSKYVSNDNKYIFAKSNTTMTISGYKVLNKYAVSCGAKQPDAITCTRLRKHLATLSQLFIMNESEIEQLASFMGHTSEIHKKSYRLPDDIYQTAKVSKLLLLMEKGSTDKYKGKLLKDIDINMDEDLLINEEDNSESEGEIEQNDNMEKTLVEAAERIVERPTNPEILTISKFKKSRNVVRWTPEQKIVVQKYFQEHIRRNKAPTQRECDELKSKYVTLLENKNWLKIKVYIQNIYTKKLKLLEDE